MVSRVDTFPLEEVHETTGCIGVGMMTLVRFSIPLNLLVDSSKYLWYTVGMALLMMVQFGRVELQLTMLLSAMKSKVQTSHKYDSV